jgi:hypothetical protein
MTSDRQIEANRRNAKFSTGPRTKQGKAASSRNALRHGLSQRDGGQSPAVAATRHRAGGASDQIAELCSNEEDLARIRVYRCALLAQIMVIPRPELLKRLRGLERYERAAYTKLKRALRESRDRVR